MPEFDFFRRIELRSLSGVNNVITSMQNEQVKHIVSLHTLKGRRESREYLIEGKRFVEEAFLRGAKLKKAYYCSKYSLEVLALADQALKLGIETEEVSETVMRRMSSTEEPQGILAAVEKDDADWQDLSIDQDSILLIIDNIQDPGNLGTILRTALAADVRQVILTKGTVDLYNPKVLRSTMGTIFSQTIVPNKTPEEIVNFCNQQNCFLAVSTMEGFSIFGEEASANYPLALVIGNEAFGTSEVFLANARQKFSIPMFNKVESLNAAMAAGIFLYELRRQAGFL